MKQTLKFGYYRLLAAFLLAIVGLLPQQLCSQNHPDPEVADIQARIKKYQDLSADRHYNAQVRGGVDTFSILATLSELAIQHEADKWGLKASDQEAEVMLIPLLTQQGLFDPGTEKGGVFQSENVLLWLKGQKMSTANLLQNARLMVLWSKIATKDAPVPTQNELAAYVQKNPQLRIIPSRIQIELSDYIAPPVAGARGLLPHQVLSPNMELSVRGGLTDMEAPPPADWRDLQLYLQLETLDPNLRSVLSGKKAGDSFGPVILKNKASVVGVVKCFLPELDLGANESFWQMASLHWQLEKSATKEKFEGLVRAYFDDSSPAVRGFWGSIFKGFKNGFKYIAGGVGGIVGFVYGGPSGAIAGARYGYQAGSMIQGFWSSGNQQQDFRRLPPASPPPTFIPQGYPTYTHYRQYNPYANTVPSIPVDYATQYERQYYTWRQPPPPPSWAPPMYLGASIWY